MARFLTVMLGAIILAACTITHPVAFIYQNGQIYRGTTTANAFSGGHFVVSDGPVTCGGDFSVWDMSPTLTIPVTCSDGRRGIATGVRNHDGTAGSGTVRLTDGTTGTFIFGDAAASF